MAPSDSPILGIFHPWHLVEGDTLTQDALILHAANPSFGWFIEESALLAAELIGTDQRTVLGPFVARGHIHSVFSTILDSCPGATLPRIPKGRYRAEIRIGAPIRSMNQSGPRIRKSPAMVPVHSFDEGFLFKHYSQAAIQDRSICWAGSGGYWSYASFADLVSVKEAHSTATRAA